ncbi:cytochrome c oxidase subunit II [Halobaculum litoreum]|uniref:cytochrome-c oxidase n=1 Tax=Halobaculum litoreum TaxID=3031998 RepID=A0ABD5XVV3_9EURY
MALVATLAAAPAAAQSVNRAAIDNLNEQLLYVALPLVLFVEITLLYAVYRFRDNDDPKPTTKDSPLEITWTAVTGIILLFVGISAYFVLANPYITPAAASGPTVETQGDPVEIDVVAYQWGWEFRYPDANVTTQGEVVVPRGRGVVLTLHTRDVIHSFYAPDLGIKQDAVPGQETTIRTRATEVGQFRVYCAGCAASVTPACAAASPWSRRRRTTSGSRRATSRRTRRRRPRRRRPRTDRLAPTRVVGRLARHPVLAVRGVRRRSPHVVPGTLRRTLRRARPLARPGVASTVPVPATRLTTELP